MSVSRKLRLVCLLCLLVCCVGCDQVSKHLARTALNHEGTRLLPGGILELRLAENPGSFLSLGAWLPPQMRFTLFTLGVGAGLAVLAAYLVRTARMDLARFIGFSLVMAGGIGNLIDRVVWKGVVTDFAVIHVGPVHTGIFNIADVLVLAGAALALYSMGKKEESNPLPNQ